MIAMPGKTQTDIAYGFTAVRRLDPRYYAYWMMNNILGQFGLGGRLADNIRERQGMAYYAFSTLDPAAGEAPLLIRAGVDPANVERAIAAIDHEVARARRQRTDRDRARRDPRLPGRIDSAAARNQPEHRRVPADVRGVRPRAGLRSAAAGAAGRRHARGDARRRRRGAGSGARGNRDCRSRVESVYRTCGAITSSRSRVPSSSSPRPLPRRARLLSCRRRLSRTAFADDRPGEFDTVVARGLLPARRRARRPSALRAASARGSRACRSRSRRASRRRRAPR